MDIEFSEQGSEITVKLIGCLDTAATAQFAQAMEKVQQATTLVLDMSALEFIASSALRQLVATKKSRGAALTIVLTGLNEVVREVFEVTGLDTIFEIR